MSTVTSFNSQIKAQPTGVPRAVQILELLPHPLLVVGSDGIVTYANASTKALLGELGGIDMVHVFPAFCGMPIAGSAVLVSKDGQYFDGVFAAFDDSQFLIDLRPSANQTRTSPIQDLDDLTGLTTRSAFLSHLSSALHSDPASSIAVHCLDLDRFKMVNDTLGHAVGDLLLKKVADRLTAACRKSDIIARLGGDEFVVLQRNVDQEEAAETLASRIVDLIGRTYVIHGHTINIGASVGVVIGEDAVRRATFFATVISPCMRRKGRGGAVTASSRAAWTLASSSAARWKSIYAVLWP